MKNSNSIFVETNFRKIKEIFKNPNFHPNDNNNFEIVQASEQNNIEALKFLLKDPRVDPSARDNLSLMYATELNYPNIVELLLKDPRVEPSTRNNLALSLAVESDFYRVAELLLNDPRTNPVANRCNLIIDVINEKDYIMLRLFLKYKHSAAYLKKEWEPLYLNIITTSVEHKLKNFE